IVTVGRAGAVDASWLANPGSGSYTTGSNWSGGTVPDGTASFGTSTVTSLAINTTRSVGGWTFNAGASDYTVNVGGES
ncbi:hypothetical protein ABTE74_23375, partial [Acinetobacter baumannii]